MLRVPFLTSGNDRKLDMGGGDTKDKMMILGLLGIVVIAIVFLVLSIAGGKDKGRLGEQVLIRCVDPDCDYQEKMTQREWGNLVTAMDEQTVRAMNPIRVLCPKCKNPKYTWVASMKCPQCGHLFVTDKLMWQARMAVGIRTKRPTGPVICPKCGVDVVDYWGKNKGKAKR